MRIIAKKPIEIVRALVNEHLQRVWPAPDQLAWMSGAQPPAPLTSCFSDRECRQPVDAGSFTTRLVCVADASLEFNVVAGLGPDAGNDLMLLLTDDMQPLFAMETGLAVRPDGMVQIAVAEPGVLLLRSDQVRPSSSDQKLLRGASLRAFRLEARVNGHWQHKPYSLELPAGVVRSVELEKGNR